MKLWKPAEFDAILDGITQARTGRTAESYTSGAHTTEVDRAVSTWLETPYTIRCEDGRSLERDAPNEPMGAVVADLTRDLG